MPTAPSQRQTLSRGLIILLVLVGVSVFINYIDRGNLSLAAPLLQDELHISSAQLGVLLSAFFWAYACLQPLYGWLVDRWNVYWLFAICFTAWSIATAATSFAHSFAILFFLRLLVGSGEAVAFPAYSKILALNYQEEHRGVANAVVACGLTLGPGIGLLLGGTLVSSFGWRPFFLWLGLGSLLWVPLWLRWMPARNVVPPSTGASAPTLMQFIRLRSAWGTCLGLFSGNYTGYFLLTWLPYYLVRERHFSMLQMTRIGGAGYLLSACFSFASGWLSDRWIRAGGTPTQVRKTFSAGGIALSGTLLCISCFVPDARLSLLPLILGMASYGISSSNVWAISQRLAGPHAAGRWVGFQNCFGNMAGVVGPVITGFVLRETGNFHWAFIILNAVVLLGTVSWIFIVGPVEQVDWGQPHEQSIATAA